MADPQKDEEKAGTETKRPSAGKATENGGTPTKSELLRLKLKRVVSVAMLGFSPVMAVLALAIAVYAIVGNQSGRAQLSKDAATIDSLNANLSATKLELEKLKAAASAASRDTALLNEKLKKQDERVARIIQNVTPMQMKLKISPTLEAQLLQPASGVAAPVAPVAAPPVREVKPAKPVKTAEPSKPAKSAESVKPAKPPKPSKSVKLSKHVEPVAAASAVAPSSAPGQQLSPQVKAMKEAIERFNKQ
jgi:hypothetical protein